MLHTKTGAAGLTIGTVALLSLLKIAVGIISGSVSIIAQAIDSLLDLFASLFTFFSLRFAGKPADREHPFGHGKAESISGVVQGGLIFAAAAYIFYQAVTRIVVGADIEYVTAGIVVMAVCIVVSIIVSRHLLRVARKTDSAALEANARNLATDVYTALGVLAGLVAVRISGLNILDPIIAIGVALFILKTAYDVVRKSFPHLIDVKLPEDEEALIESTMREHMGELVGFHSLRTRKAGSERYIELHMIMARDASVERAHNLCDHLEEDIKSKLPNASVTIHVEPCDRECDSCPDNCPLDQRTPGP
ncbi:MAG: cation diffusion facilitator family transporter [Dehalococcoidia bacterium]|nr:cation diffusion facilitator family transporter [Dehalococcoidia bacterium]